MKRMDLESDSIDHRSLVKRMDLESDSIDHRSLVKRMDLESDSSDHRSIILPAADREMQAPPPSPLRPHWIPFEPAWIFVGGLTLLAVLPHQVPRTGRRLLASWAGLALGVALAAWLFFYAKTPVLATAFLLFVAAVHIFSYNKQIETFYAAPILVKDAVPAKKPRWFQEEVLMEDPHGIQERTEEGGFLVDEVAPGGHHWEVESVMGEQPVAIQERPVAPMDSSDNPYATGASQRPTA